MCERERVCERESVCVEERVCVCEGEIVCERERVCEIVSACVCKRDRQRPLHHVPSQVKYLCRSTFPDFET